MFARMSSARFGPQIAESTLAEHSAGPGASRYMTPLLRLGPPQAGRGFLSPVAVEGYARVVSAADTRPVVDEVLRFEDLPPEASGSRRAVVRWSDGSEGVALTWYADEVLVCEGDLVGKTAEQLRSLHFRRDRDWLQS